MNKQTLEKLLNDVKDNKLDVQDALNDLESLPFQDLGFAKIDNHREIRVGYPEVIYGEGKTVAHVQKIVTHMKEHGSNILVTRCSEEMAQGILETCPEAHYNQLGRTVTVVQSELKTTEDYIAIVAAGTSDLPVVEEAYETARLLGNSVKKITDVGVAGIHRLFANLDDIQNAKVIIVVAGMEGALASVVGGLVKNQLLQYQQVLAMEPI